MAQSSKDATDHRRKCDREEYERLAKERLEEESQALLAPSKKDVPVKCELLTPGENEAFNRMITEGSIDMMTKTTQAYMQGGYHCMVCGRTVQDSINFVDHLNDEKHYRILGVSLEIISLYEVKELFEINKKTPEEKMKAYEDFEQRLKELKIEEQEACQRRDRRRNVRKRREEAKSDISSMMGFSTLNELKEERQKNYRREKRKDRKRKMAKRDEEAESDSDISSMVGFSGPNELKEERQKNYRREKRKDRKRKMAKRDEEAESDSDIYSTVGFSGPNELKEERQKNYRREKRKNCKRKMRKMGEEAESDTD